MFGKGKENCRKNWLGKIDKVCIIRSVVVSVLLVAAALSGAYTKFYFDELENEQVKFRYRNSVTRGLTKLQESLRTGLRGMTTLARVASSCNSNESAWPNVIIPGFYDIATELREMTLLGNIAFMPIVKPEQLPKFETYMYNYFDSSPYIPLGAGVHDFGKGVYAYKPNHTGTIYHDTTGVVLRYESPNRILVPMLQILFANEQAVDWLTFNVHSSPQIGPGIDFIIDNCSVYFPRAASDRRCGYISNIIPEPVRVQSDMPGDNQPDVPVTDVSSFILQPVYLHRNTSHVVGFTMGEISWQKILNESFFGLVGFDVVIVNGADRYTYRIDTAGYDATFVGVGDLHDREYSSFGREVNVTADTIDQAVLTPYRVLIYPNNKYFDRVCSNTNTPTLIGVGIALVIGLFTVIFVMYDILMRREAGRRAKMLDTKRKFVRFISHEIRTPLNSVHLGLELLVEELKHQAQQVNASASISTSLLARMRESLAGWLELSADLMGNSESAVDVLNDLLNYDKIEMGTLRLDYAVVAVWPLVGKCTRAFTMQAKQKEIKMSLSGGPWESDEENMQVIVVIGDSSRIAQVMRNLLSNALKFTPEGGNINVTVAWEKDGLPLAVPHSVPEDKEELTDQVRAGSVRICVKDSGVGLSPEQLAEIGKEGLQFNANKLQAGQGSGLGLYISKGIVQQHGGNLTVTSDGLGTGATFCLELPLYQQDKASAAPPIRLNVSFSHDVQGEKGGEKKSDNLSPSTRSKAAAKEPHETQTRRILVVDDAVSNRKMLMRLLKARGFLCEQAEDGQQALDVYRALQDRGEHVDTVVMDYEMPVMDGPTATRALRQQLGCTCLIVGVTGNLLPDDVDYFKKQGANAVLGKPLNVRAFEEILSNFYASKDAKMNLDKSKGAAEKDEKPTGEGAPFTHTTSGGKTEKESASGIEMV